MRTFVKVTLNSNNSFERIILDNLKENKAGDLKRLAYEGIMYKQFLNGFCIADQPATQIRMSSSPLVDISDGKRQENGCTNGNTTLDAEQSERDIALRSICGDF